MTISNEKGLTYTWEGAGERNTVIGQANVNVSAGGYTCTVKMEWNQGGSWRSSQVQAATLTGYTINNLVMIPIVAENGDDTDINDAIVYFTYNKK